MSSLWFHIDMDAFFASIEQRDNPELRGKPVIVGAPPGHRGVVSTCSYEARAYGVHSAMPTSQAFALCPHGIFVIPRMRQYLAVSISVMRIFSDFTPKLVQVSVDEAFLDMTGTRRLLGPPEDIAHRIKAKVKQDLNLTISIGIASNKYVAKIASGLKKPDGLTIVDEGKEEEFMQNLPLEKVWGLGKQTLHRLHEHAIRTTKALSGLPLQLLRGKFGEASGEFLYKVCRGIDPGIYEGKAKQHSISAETTFEYDIDDRTAIEMTLFDLCNHVVFRLLSEAAMSYVLFVKFRNSDFVTRTVRKKAQHPLSSIEEVYSLALELLNRLWDGKSQARLIGIGFDDVKAAQEDNQLNLFSDAEARRARVEKAVLAIRDKYSSSMIGKASLLENKESRRRSSMDFRNE